MAFRMQLSFSHTWKLVRKLKACACVGHYSTGNFSQLTKDRYPIKRGQYANLTDKDINFFESILPRQQCVTDSNDLASHNITFFGECQGNSKLMLKPKTTHEVSAILKYCNNRRLAVCPQGGNTGLVGGSVPVFDEIILSMQLMNQIEHVDETAGILVCQSGCVLEKLEENVSGKGLCMPIDLGAKGSCHIGGNVSTNAGGLRLLRYGNLHGNVLGVEAVKADGTILDLMSNFKKDNTGYHLKHLFIGSEGTLGVITKLAIACPTTSKAVNVAFVGLESYEAVLKTFVAAKRELSEILSGCELIDQKALRLSVDYFNLKRPIAEHPFYMLLETSGSNQQHDEGKLTNFLESSLYRGDVLDGTVTGDKGKVNQIWQLRELIPVAWKTEKLSLNYDVSLPLSHYYDLVPVLSEHVGDMADVVCGFGHLGDSNLHVHILYKECNKEIRNYIEPFIYNYTANLKGSISAEHGIGFLKKKYLKNSKSNEALELMKLLKMVMDPNGILNPYKVLK